MSNLLQSVLSSRLANASLNDDSQNGAESLNDWEQVDSEDEVVQVRSVPATAIGTPVERPSSPVGSGSPGPSRLAVETDTTDQDSDVAASIAAKRPTLKSRVSRKTRTNRTDPLRSLTSEIAQHIFLQLSVDSLLSCSAVCKRWRRSATLNYCWYRHYQHTYSSTSLDSNLPSIPAWGSGGAKWTRRESKTDWKTQYGKQKRIEQKDAARAESLPTSGNVTPSRSQRLQDAGIQTAQQIRMQQWKEEEEAGFSKQEMRDYYKSGAKGGKFKGKREKGGVKTGSAADGGLWE